MVIYEVWIHYNGEHIKLWETEDFWLARKYIYGYPKKCGEILTIRKKVHHNENN